MPADAPPVTIRNSVLRLLGDGRIAIGFFTRLPPPLAAGGDVGAGSLARASGLFPLAGALVGGVAALALVVAHALGLGAPAAALIAVFVAAALTGGLHEDGLADLADGLGGGADAGRRLDIMRDSRIGTFGALALIFSVGLRVAALSQIAAPVAAAGALIAAHALSRAVLVPLLKWLPPARADGLAVFAGKPSTRAVAVAMGVGAVIALLVLTWPAAIVAIILASLGALSVGWVARRSLGGLTGDGLGTAQQKAEILVLLSVAAIT